MVAPFVPADVDLRDFPYFPVYRSRLFGSAFHAQATDAEWRAGVTLWLKAWDQTPSGSLPDNDVELCRLAELGRDTKTWLKLKPMALHGWEKCDDGRLYHSTVAEVVTEAWERKTAQRHRTEAATAASVASRRQLYKANVTDNVTSDVTLNATDNVTSTVTDNVTSTKRREGKRRDGKALSLRSRAPSSPLRFEEEISGRRPDSARARERDKIFAKGLKLLGSQYRPLIAKMLENRGNAIVDEALNAIDAANPDEPAKAFARLCAEPETPQHRGPDGPPPTPEEAERRWNELERLHR